MSSLSGNTPQNLPYVMPQENKVSTKELFNQLVENALDFLARSIGELGSSPKYSVIHFHAAVELFLKGRLMADHWTLVVTKTQEPDWEKFVAGDFRSVSLDEAASKLEKAVRSGLTKQEFDAFDNVRKHRNQMVHFFHEAHTPAKSEGRIQQIAKQQLNAWYLLHRLLNTRWKPVFGAWSKQIEKIDRELRKHHDFLQFVFDNLGKEIQKRKKAGSKFRPCPSCGFKSQEHQQELGEIYEAVCLVCELVEKYLTIECPDCGAQVDFLDEGFSECESCKKKFEPKDVVDILLDEGKVRIVDEDYCFANCSYCDGYHTVVAVHFDQYLCVSCFGLFDSLQYCGWCNEPNTGDMEYSSFSGCSHCDGKAGWHADD